MIEDMKLLQAINALPDHFAHRVEDGLVMMECATAKRGIRDSLEEGVLTTAFMKGRICIGLVLHVLTGGVVQSELEADQLSESVARKLFEVGSNSVYYYARLTDEQPEDGKVTIELVPDALIVFGTPGQHSFINVNRKDLPFKQGVTFTAFPKPFVFEK